jgi:hypothetical protein
VTIYFTWAPAVRQAATILPMMGPRIINITIIAPSRVHWGGHRSSKCSSSPTQSSNGNPHHYHMLGSTIGIAAWIDDFCVICPSASQPTPRSLSLTQFARVSHNQQIRFSIRFDPAPIIDPPVKWKSLPNEDITVDAGSASRYDPLYVCSPHSSFLDLPASTRWIPNVASSHTFHDDDDTIQCVRGSANTNAAAANLRPGPYVKPHRLLEWDLSPATTLLRESLSAHDNSHVIVVEDYDSEDSWVGYGGYAVATTPLDDEDGCLPQRTSHECHRHNGQLSSDSSTSNLQTMQASM